MDAPPVRGRPRSETARRAVLDAALQLCQSGGYPALTMKGIAETAGVGRQTVYRWWPAKQDVLIDALRDLALVRAEQLDPDSGDTLRDVRTLLTATFTLANQLTGNALIGLMAEAQHDPVLSRRLQSTVIGPRRHALRALLDRGVARGELGGAVSLDLAVDFAFGTMWYRLISRHAPVDGTLAEEITDALANVLGRETPDGGAPAAAGTPPSRPPAAGSHPPAAQPSAPASAPQEPQPDDTPAPLSPGAAPPPTAG